MVEFTDNVIEKLPTYTVKELQALAKDMGLKSTTGKKKQVLIDMITKAARSDQKPGKNQAPGLFDSEDNNPQKTAEADKPSSDSNHKASAVETKSLSGKTNQKESSSSGASFVKESRLGGKKPEPKQNKTEENKSSRQEHVQSSSLKKLENKPAESTSDGRRKQTHNNRRQASSEYRQAGSKSFNKTSSPQTLNKEEEARLEEAIREAKNKEGVKKERQQTDWPKKKSFQKNRNSGGTSEKQKEWPASSPQKRDSDNNNQRPQAKQQQKKSFQNKNKEPQQKQQSKQQNQEAEEKSLPVSTATDLLERVKELKPQLGGNIINEGTLEILPDGYGFLRSVTYHFQSSPDDIYVSPSQIKRFALRQGDTVVGIIRPPKVGERYFALLRVEGVNGLVPNNVDARPDFEDLLPVYPEKRLKLETSPFQYATRLMDLFAPLGKGQRGLIVAQPKTGKTSILRMTANAVAANNPEAKIMILLVDERPEEVTEMRRNVANAEVMASTFDMKPENHIALAELVFEKAKRLVESGHDVVLLMDSLTRLARAYNIATNSGRTMSGGVDSEALKKPRKLFSLARNVENGGSLTILATALVNTGSRMDDVIFEEFKGTGNMELVLERRIAEQRVFPAIDVFKSGTRREELFVREDEREKVVLLRRFLSNMSPLESIEFLLSKINGTRNNQEFLISMNQ
jgi:transcription termination factor Rho